MNRPALIALAFVFHSGIVAGKADEPIAVGQPVPEVTLRTADDKDFDLRGEIGKKPAVIVFYRGGWCPFCTKHLSGLAGIEKDLARAGFQLLAVGIDQPSKLREKPEYRALDYTLLSDSSARASKAFGIAFEVPGPLVKKYKSGYGIDIEAASGETHHLLPHPSVFVVDSSGVVRFAHVDEDYKVRLDPRSVLAAARKISGSGNGSD